MLRVISKRRKYLGRGRKLLLVFALLLVFSVIIAAVYEKSVSPIVSEAALYTVTDVVSQKINAVVREKINAGMLDYEKLVSVKQDDNGDICALITNMANANMLQSEISDDIMFSLTDNFTSDLKIPIGNILGGALFYGRGPLVPVKLKSVTNVNTAFENNFISAGINQTRHQIKLNISVDIRVLIPGQELKTTVKTNMVIAETVIVGSVPDNYADLKG